MIHLSENQFAAIVLQLQSARHALLEEIRQQIRDSEQAEQFDRWSQLKDPGDYSVADVMRDMELDQLDRETEQLRDIEDAEVRIQKGVFGECIDCDTEINAERLLVYPTASRCMECQEIYEKTHLTQTGNGM